MVLGMGTVFVGLIMLILLTKLMSAVIGKGKGASLPHCTVDTDVEKTK